MSTLKALYASAASYTALGLVSGLHYRELTRNHDFEGRTQLAIVHTHLLVLGTVVFLLLLVLQAAFALDEDRLFRPFLWLYHAGLIVTAGMQTLKGTLQVTGGNADSGMIAGISGTGHILLTLAFMLFFVVLKNSIWAREPAARR